ncbi:hypothetical protein [Solicola sp. PLA-1-18]|uniref:hypothetical protein n=1 Tax=Solicola sp. PLA-1-18 TaxID=3380532 RepID=UPI003B82AC9C
MILTSTASTDDAPTVMRSGDAAERWGRARVRNQLASGRWQSPERGVVVRHNGPLTPGEKSWVDLLSCAPGAALGGLDALAWDGLQGFCDDRTFVVLPPGASPPRREGVEPHWSIYLDGRDVSPAREPRRTRPARSVVDYASWAPNDRIARAVVLASVQQRLAQTRHFTDAIRRRGACRRRALVKESVLDAAGASSRCPSATSTRSSSRTGCPGRPVSCPSAGGTAGTSSTSGGASTTRRPRSTACRTWRSGTGTPTTSAATR